MDQQVITARRALTLSGLLMLSVIAGCAQPKMTAPVTSKPLANPPAQPAQHPPPAAEPPHVVATSPAEAAAPLTTKPVDKSPSKVTNTPPVKSTVQPPPKKPSPSSPKPTAPVSNSVTTAPTAAAIVPAKPSPTPTLDLKSLEQRLRDTRAIGTFTKLSLKNQVDDLLDEFRAFYKGKTKIPLATLRQRYDLLIMKVLTLLQDSDVSLAANIASSREAIWGILKDPEQFSKI